MWLLVMSFNVLLDNTNQRRDIVKATPADLFLGQFTEPPLHHVQPGSGCRREVELEAWMPTEPGPDARMLVGAVIIHDEVELQVGRCLAIDFLEESNELLVSMTRHAVPYDFAIEHTECGK